LQPDRKWRGVTAQKGKYRERGKDSPFKKNWQRGDTKSGRIVWRDDAFLLWIGG